jgi:MOSC domain-containing protein YiiM
LKAINPPNIAPRAFRQVALNAKIARVSTMNGCEGKVLSVAYDSQHRFSKQPMESITLVEGYGVAGDAHAGEYAKHRFLAKRSMKLPNRRQVHLIPAELFAELREDGYLVEPGHLGENVTTYGIGLEHLPLGTKLHIGENAIIELTGLRTPCGQIDAFQKGLRRNMFRSDGSAAKYRCGVLGIVLSGGQLSPGDGVRVQAPLEPYSPLPGL